MRHSTVTQGNWSVGCEYSDPKDVTLHVFSFPLGMHRDKPMRKGDAYGMHFTSTESAYDYALQHGYLQHYYRGMRWCLKRRVRNDRHETFGFICPEHGLSCNMSDDE